MRPRFPGDTNYVRAARQARNDIARIDLDEFPSEAERVADQLALMRHEIRRKGDEAASKRHINAVRKARAYIERCKRRNVEPNPDRISKVAARTMIEMMIKS